MGSETCRETLGKHGGPVALPCGHNACLQCISEARRIKPEVCRSTAVTEKKKSE